MCIRDSYDMGILAAAVAGSTLGFLRHNFHPARIFMGDSGSLLLGFLLAAITLQGFLKGVATVALVIPLLVLGIPIFDTGFAILRRVKNRRPVYLADRGHLHHRFSNLGYSQRQTVAIIYAWSGLMSAVALAMRFAPKWVTGVLGAVAGIVSLALAYKLEILRWHKVTQLLGGATRPPAGGRPSKEAPDRPPASPPPAERALDRPPASPPAAGPPGRDGIGGERSDSPGERHTEGEKTS